MINQNNTELLLIKLKQNNEYALVTGATSGTGFELAKLLANDGYNLEIVGRSKETLNKIAEILKSNGVKISLFNKTYFIRTMFILYMPN